MIRNGYGLVLSLNHQTLGLIVGFTAWLRCIQQSFPTLEAARPHKSGSAGAPCQAGSTWPRAYFPSKILRQFCVFCACSDLQRVVFLLIFLLTFFDWVLSPFWLLLTQFCLDRYVEEVCQLFEQNKESAGYGDTMLRIVLALNDCDLEGKLWDNSHIFNRLRRVPPATRARAIL